MRSFILHAYPDKAFKQRLGCALDLTRTFGGFLKILYPIPNEASVPDDFYGAAFSAMIPVWRQRAEKMRAEVEEDLANEEVHWEWIEAGGNASSALVRHSALSDLMIVSAREAQSDKASPSTLVGELVLRADCPVLILPETQNRIEVGAPALVAFDGSAEASHALRAAIPFLKLARSVHFIYLKDPAFDQIDELPVLCGAEYLSQHNIASDITEIDRGADNTGKVLIRAAEMRNAGLIVMGAYGRRRLTERIFGGATRSMLSDVRIPLLMTH